MTPDEMRTTWRELLERMDALESEMRLSGVSPCDPRMTTSIDNLKKRYRMFITIEMLMLPLTIMWTRSDIIADERFRLPLMLAFCLFYIIAAAMDLVLYRGVASIDVYTMPVSDVCAKARHYRKMHLMMMSALIPLAIGLLILLCCAFGSESLMLWSVLCGAVAGLAIGLVQLHRFMTDYRRLF